MYKTRIKGQGTKEGKRAKRFRMDYEGKSEREGLKGTGYH